jgi:hypothetical protein
MRAVRFRTWAGTSSAATIIAPVGRADAHDELQRRVRAFGEKAQPAAEQKRMDQQQELIDQAARDQRMRSAPLPSTHRF